MREKSPILHYPSAILASIRRGVPRGFVKNLSWQYTSTIWVTGVGFLYTLVVARKLGSAELGLMSLAIGVTGLVFNLVELRLHEAVIRYISEFWEAGDHARVVAFVKLSLIANAASALLALFCVLGFIPLAGGFLIQDARATLVLILAGFTVFCSTLAGPTAIGLLRVFGRFKSYALITILGVSLKFSLTLIVIYALSWHILGVMVVGLVTSGITNILLITVAMVILGQQVPWKHTVAPLSVLRPRFREIAKFVAYRHASSIMVIPTRNLDVALLGKFASLEIVGLYHIAKNFVSVMWKISDPVFFVIYPELAKLWQKQHFVLLQAFVKRIVLIFGLAGLAMTIAALLIVPGIITMFIGQSFAEAGQLFQLMAWSVVVWMPLLWVNPLLMSAGRPDLCFRAALFGSLSTVVLFAGCIPLWGGYGAAFAYGMSIPLTLIPALWMGKQAGLIFPRLCPVN